MIKGILIDMGGTIIRSNNFSFKRSFERMYDLAILPNVSKNEFIDYSMNIIEDIFRKRDNNEIDLTSIIKLLITIFNLKFNIEINDIEEEMNKSLCDNEYIEGIIDLLEYYKSKNLKIVILSNTCFSRDAIVSVLKDHLELFDDIIVSSDYNVRKPYKAFFDLGLSVIGLNRDEVVYIGNDFFFDIIGATKSNIKAVWFNEYHKTPLDNSIDNYYEVGNYYENILKDLIYE